MRFSNSGSTASGVTSRPVKPVPPVVMTASMAGSAIHLRTTPRILRTSSVHDRAVGEHVAGRFDALGKRRARAVVGERAGVGNGQHREADRNERLVVSFRHDAPPL